MSGGWRDHPALAAACAAGVCTRLGVAPNHPSFRVGVLRTHLLSAMFAHALGGHLRVPVSVYLRWDDTNRRRTGAVPTDGLLAELRDVALIPLRVPPPAISGGEPALRQSRRRSRYQEALSRLVSLGVVFESAGTWSLDVRAADALIAEAGDDPDSLARSAAVNVTGVPSRPATASVRLTRGDGSVLWHLSSVVDDIDLEVNLVVRGTDKLSSVATQERVRWLLTGGERRPGYLFVPRIVESDRQVSRVAYQLAQGVRPAALRWFMAEICLTDDTACRPPQDFADLVRLVRPILPRPHDSAFDVRRLHALDRKLSPVLDPRLATAEILTGFTSPDRRAGSWVARNHRRSLMEQRRLYAALVGDPIGYDPPPRDAGDALSWLSAWLRRSACGQAPNAVAWVLTGLRHGPPAEALLGRMSEALIRARLGEAAGVAGVAGPP